MPVEADIEGPDASCRIGPPSAGSAICYIENEGVEPIPVIRLKAGL